MLKISVCFVTVVNAMLFCNRLAATSTKQLEGFRLTAWPLFFVGPSSPTLLSRVSRQPGGGSLGAPGHLGAPKVPTKARKPLPRCSPPAPQACGLRRRSAALRVLPTSAGFEKRSK